MEGMSREKLEKLRQRLAIGAGLEGVSSSSEEKDLAMVRFLAEMSRLEATASLKLNELL